MTIVPSSHDSVVSVIVLKMILFFMPNALTCGH